MKLKRKAPESPIHWIGELPTDPAPILYFSGYTCVTNAELRVMKRTGLRYRCMSYAFLGDKKFMPHSTQYMREAQTWCNKHGVRIFLDSGAFSVQQAIRKGKKTFDIEAVIRSYADYVLGNLEAGLKYDFYATFDYLKQAPLVYQVTKRLQKEFGLKPTAVYHGDSSLDWVRRYHDEGHRLLCVGRIKALGSMGLRKYYESLFELADKLGGMRLHGLMVTGQNIFRFPWYSVDSATWTRLAANGRLAAIDIKRRKIGHFRVSRVQIPTPLRELIQSNGFDVEKIATDPEERAIYNVREFQKIITDPAYLKAMPKWKPVI